MATISDPTVDSSSGGRYQTLKNCTGRAQGIRATPAYVVNGEVLFGLYPIGTWQKIIDRKLAEVIPVPAQVNS